MDKLKEWSNFQLEGFFFAYQKHLVTEKPAQLTKCCINIFDPIGLSSIVLI